MNTETDLLKLYFGDDYIINDYITIRHPKLDDVINFGEGEYFSVVHSLCCIPSDMKPQLWKMGIIWEDISDFDLFKMLSVSLPIEKTSIFFGDLDFTKFSLGINNDNGEIILHQMSPSGERIVIDNRIYSKIVSFLRKMHNIKPKPVTTGKRKKLQQMLIEDDITEQKLKSKEPVKSSLQTMVSSLINTAEFSYKLDEVRLMPFYAFIDSVNRVQIVKSTNALLNGCYSGMIDASKIDKKEFNFMREIENS